MLTSGVEQNSGLPGRLSRLADNAGEWSAERVLDEGLDIARDATWSDSVSLLVCQGDLVTSVAGRPTALRLTGNHADTSQQHVDADWFPWGLGSVAPQRFLLISDAAQLPAAPGSSRTLGDDNVVSCLHMPLLDRHRSVGAIQLFWNSPRLEWDDEQGPLLRMLGRFLVDWWVHRLTPVESA